MFQNELALGKSDLRKLKTWQPWRSLTQEVQNLHINLLVKEPIHVAEDINLL